AGSTAPFAITIVVWATRLILSRVTVQFGGSGWTNTRCAIRPVLTHRERICCNPGNAIKGFRATGTATAAASGGSALLFPVRRVLDPCFLAALRAAGPSGRALHQGHRLGGVHPHEVPRRSGWTRRGRREHAELLRAHPKQLQRRVRNGPVCGAYARLS